MQICLESGGITAFVVEIYKAVNEGDRDRKYWEMYLHKVDTELPFEDWKQEQIQRSASKTTSKAELTKALVNSAEILENFKI